MSTTRYLVNHNGREWYPTDEDKHHLRYWKDHGATITAETTSEEGGIPLSKLSTDAVGELATVADANGWEQVTQMIRAEQQKRVLEQ